MYLLPTLNFALAVAGLLMAVAAVALFLDYFLYKGKYFNEKVKELYWPMVIGLTVGSIAMSLLYSEYFGFIPCSLCWLQRIAIYPQGLMSIIAFRVQDNLHLPMYGIGLSIFGFVVAVYQYIYQFLPKETLASGVAPCLLDGTGADCAAKIIDEFGFVTFPFLSAVTFALLIAVYLYASKWSR